MNEIKELFSTGDYDKCLKESDHYKKYPEMLPWIGEHYYKSELKILIIAESHYLPKDINIHHDVDGWYKGICLKDKGGINTRKVICRYTNKTHKRKAYAIFSNIGTALTCSSLPISSKNKYLVYEDIAFINFFQRPAEQTGKSIKVHELDKKVSNEVLINVICCIEPDIVIFTSTTAYNNAKGLRNSLDSKKIAYVRTSHPATPYWHMKVKKYGNKTGKEVFIEFIDNNC